MSLKNKSVFLTSRPQFGSNPTEDNFGINETTIDPSDLKDGQILVKSVYGSIDPYLIFSVGNAQSHGDQVEKQPPNNRKQFKDGSPVNIGETFGGRGAGVVVASKHHGYKVDDLVACDYRWVEYVILDVEKEATLEKLEDDIFKNGGVSLSYALGALGVSGSHALNGYRFLKVKEGETIVVSAAGGNIGHIVGQIAKIYGNRVIGIAGGADKCESLKRDLGFDEVIDYRIANNDVQKLTDLIKKAAPQGVDAYFDNVGGPVTEAVDNNLNNNARVYVCGNVSGYASGGYVTISERSKEIYKNKNANGITCLEIDYISNIPESRRELFEWIKNGKIKPVEWISDGIESAPKSYADMYRGKNYGKSLIKF